MAEHFFALDGIPVVLLQQEAEMVLARANLEVKQRQVVVASIDLQLADAFCWKG